MLGRQPGLQSRQGYVRMGLDMGRKSGLLCRRQFARPVTAPRAGVHLAGAPPPDQRFVDVGHADPEHARRRPRRHAAVNRRQNPPPQVLRIALSLPPSHRHPQHLAVGAANAAGLGTAFSDSSQCGFALASVRMHRREEASIIPRPTLSVSSISRRWCHVRTRIPDLRPISSIRLSNAAAACIGKRKKRWALSSFRSLTWCGNAPLVAAGRESFDGHGRV
jgi:hypothetical protein